MADRLTREQRSRNMSAIKGKNTKPEITVRKYLHNSGFRFRLHKKGLPGKPDIVLAKWKTVVFVHGCFWHRHKGCKHAYTPKSNVESWQDKFDSNVRRDLKNNEELRKLGWKVLVIWECEVKHKNLLHNLIDEIKKG